MRVELEKNCRCEVYTLRAFEWLYMCGTLYRYYFVRDFVLFMVNKNRRHFHDDIQAIKTLSNGIPQSASKTGSLLKMLVALNERRCRCLTNMSFETVNHHRFDQNKFVFDRSLLSARATNLIKSSTNQLLKTLAIFLFVVFEVNKKTFVGFS